MDIKLFHPFLAIGIAMLVLSLLAIPIAASVRKQRRAAAGKRRAKSLVNEIRLAASPKAAEADRKKIPALIKTVNDLSAEYGFPLYEIGASKERFDKWLYIARHRPEDQHPLMRRLLHASMQNAPENVLNPDEPGTPGLLINGMLCLPAATSGSDDRITGTAPLANVIIPPPPDPRQASSDAIVAMIDDALTEIDRGPRRPEPNAVEVICAMIDDDGEPTEIIIEVEVPPEFRDRMTPAPDAPAHPIEKMIEETLVEPPGKESSVSDFVEHAFQRMVLDES